MFAKLHLRLYFSLWLWLKLTKKMRIFAVAAELLSCVVLTSYVSHNCFSVSACVVHDFLCRIIVDLLHMNVAPVAIERMLRTMASSSRHQSVPVSGTESQTSLSTTRSVSSISNFATPVSHSQTDSSKS